MDEILIAVPSATSKQMQRFVRICEECGTRFKTLPALHDVITGEARIREFRDVHLEDLLGRDPVEIDLRAVRKTIEGRVVLVTAPTYATAGDAERTKKAYDRAQTSFPMSAEVAWRYGNFLMYQENYSEAYPKIRKAISIDPSLTQSALHECWQSNPEVASIVKDLLPDKHEYYVSAVGLFLAQKLADPAVAVWARQRERGLAVDMEETVALVDALISEDSIGKAQQVWRSGLQASNWALDSEEGRSLVLNGGFEHDIDNGGFDWREVPLSTANFDFDSAFAHSGIRSLRVEFDGTENVDFGHLFQYVPVASDIRYHFSAFVRTEGLTTDRGISFEILDAHHPEQVQVATCELTGTNAWTVLQTDFVSGPETQAVKIRLRRMPSWKFDNKFSGTVWVDDVTL